MPGTRDHPPLVIEDFQGLWVRGDDESAPSDHFTQADNIQYGHSFVETRDGIIQYFNNLNPPLKVVRIYNYVTQVGQALVLLVEGGKIYFTTGPDDVIDTSIPILSIPAMEDFGFVAINGRGYITPFKTYVNPTGERYQLGLKNEFVYVFSPDTFARKAAGFPPTGSPLLVSEFAPGPTPVTDTGFHLIAVVYETDTGYLTALGPEVFGSLNFSGAQLYVSNIPLGPAGSGVIKRHLVSTKAITGYNGDQTGYQFFFIPGGTIPDNTTPDWQGHYFDADLISDASHLIDNFSEIPAGVALTTYHSRLIIVGEFGTTETLANLPPDIKDNRSLVRVSFPGEPESISKIDGVIIAPLDGKALTNAQEFRDNLYVFKNTRTIAYSDNYDVPASWQEEVLDQGIGAPVHGIATVLDTGGVNIDFLLIVDWSGLMLFNGTYAQPEMSWKIEDLWRSLDRNRFNEIQIVNDSLNKKIWITLPSPMYKTVLHANYQNGMSSKDIRWSKWIFDVNVRAIALTETDRLVLGTPGP